MAHGFECTECGFQESEHSGITADDRACGSYKSPDPKLEAKLWAADKEGRDQQEAMRYRGPVYEH